ncbi:MAG: hypothetical protein ACTSSE_19500 [Candidatus Thorarchaeota archaeon]
MTTQLNENEPDKFFPLQPDEKFARYVQQFLKTREELVHLDRSNRFKDCLGIIEVREQFNLAMKELAGPFIITQNVLNIGYALQTMERIPLDPRKHNVMVFRDEVKRILEIIEVPFYRARLFTQQKNIDAMNEVCELDRLRLLYKGALVRAALRELEEAGICTLGRKQEEAF